MKKLTLLVAALMVATISFAQQGSMYIFVIIIFIYVSLINKLDSRYKKEKND